MTKVTDRRAPLEHIRVLDLSRVRSGPSTVRQLVDWGAQAIRVEPPAAVERAGALDPARATSDFQNLHRNKRAITLDLRRPEGRDILMRLVEQSDVLVENFRPGVKARLGLSYEDLAEVNPRVVLASISGFGQDGPYADRPGFDQIAQGMGGLMSVTGEPGRGPMRAGIPIADLCAGLFCAFGILVALIERERSGSGQWVHTSLLESQVFMLDFQAARWLMEGEVAGQVGNSHPTSVPTGAYPTTDGAVNIGVTGETMWDRFTNAIGRQAWKHDPRFRDQPSRLQHRNALADEVADITRTMNTSQLMDMLGQHGVPAGEINSVPEVFDDPQVRHLGVAQPVSTSAFGDVRTMRQPVNLVRSPSVRPRRAPEKGEHTDEVLDSLGIDAEARSKLRERGVI